MEMAGASLRFFCSSLRCKASSSTSFFCTFFNDCDRRQFQVGFWVAATLCPFLWKNIVALLLYPFLWTWTIISTLWFMSARSWLPEEGQKWGSPICLLFSYYGLVLVDMIQVPDWAIEAAGQEMRAMDQFKMLMHTILVFT
nr:E3 ubiquitin-protein ligase SIS3-like [Ipomoea batatas]